MKLVMRKVVESTGVYSAREEYWRLKLECGHTVRVTMARTAPMTWHCRTCARKALS